MTENNTILGNPHEIHPYPMKFQWGVQLTQRIFPATTTVFAKVDLPRSDSQRIDRAAQASAAVRCGGVNQNSW